MISARIRRKTVRLIKEARDAGAHLVTACKVCGISYRTFLRWTDGPDIARDKRPAAKRPVPDNKLSISEEKQILKVCHSPEFASLPPGQIVPLLADMGIYLASESTFYRVLHKAGEQHHRSRSKPPHKPTPPKGYCACRANEVWSWDITWLPSQIKGIYYYLYVVMDVYSRKIVGWEINSTETAQLGADFIHKTILAEKCIASPPVLHADNGGAQKGYTIKAKLEALGVIKSYSRPGVSNDNPYSEALFRTCKYHRSYPEKPFSSIEESRQWVSSFVQWYNREHLHSGIRYVTPEDRHCGRDLAILAKRKQVYEKARSKNPNRWSRQTRNWEAVDSVWLNRPKEELEKVGRTL